MHIRTFLIRLNSCSMSPKKIGMFKLKIVYPLLILFLLIQQQQVFFEWYEICNRLVHQTCSFDWLELDLSSNVTT